MTAFRISARFAATPPAAHWREQLAARMGSRPRRLGLWAELGLYGALECLAGEGPARLGRDAVVVLGSQHGPSSAMRSAVEQLRDGLPFPLTFMQIQPNQLLAALSAQLDWSGDMRFITHADPLAELNLALVVAQGRMDGLLVGWVNALDALSSVWLRIQPVPDPDGAWQVASDFESVLERALYVKRECGGLRVIIAPHHSTADQVR